MLRWMRGWRLAVAVAGAAVLLAVASWTTEPGAAASWTTVSQMTEDGVVARGDVLWDPGGEPLSVEDRDQEYPRLVGDGESGAIVVWEDGRGGDPGIYAQRVLSDGTAAWPTNGVSLSGHGSVWYPLVTEDGAGGAIVVWQDWRDGNRDVYAQRVLPDGTVAWATGGVPVRAGPGEQSLSNIVPDDAEGAIVGWRDTTDADADIYAQRVLSDGTSAWVADGVTICATVDDQTGLSLASDGAGGAIVAWTDYRGSDADIYAQRVLLDGTVMWATDGVAACTAAGAQVGPRVVSDGMGGAIVMWEDRRAGEYNIDLYAQRVLSDGTVAWATDGVPLTQAPGYQWAIAVGSDGAGGAIVAWQDERTGDSQIYAQRVLSDGTVAWATDGTWISTETTYGYSPDILGDGAGGAWVVWRCINVHAQRLRPDGTARWTETLLVSNSNTGRGQDYPRLVSDGAGGALVAWQDNRRWYKVDNYDIYAQRIGEVSYRYYFPAVFED